MNISPPSSPPADFLQDLPLKLRILAGSCTQSARSALTLGPGSVVVLDSDILGQVRILVGNKLLAQGKLVSSAGRLAIQVIAIAEEHEHN